MAVPELLQPIAPLYSWIAQYFMPWGLVLLFILALLENIPIVGLVNPGEVIVAAAAFLATDLHHSLALVFAVALVGSLIGVTATYAAGRRLGVDGLRRILIRYNARKLPKFLRVDPQVVDDLREYFEQHGTITTLTARFVYGMKAFIPPVAGAMRMSYPRFLLNSFIGGALYTLFLVVVGWFLMSNAALAANLLSGLGAFGIVLLVALAVFAAVMLKRITGRRRRRALLREKAGLTSVSEQGRLSSTNDHLKELVATGQALAGESLLVIAREQKAGRGQFERQWSSPKGGLYASLLYWPRRPVAQQSELSLIVAQALSEVLSAQGVSDLWVKPPNDVYCGQGKLAGILLETSGEEGWLVIGVGVNVRRPRRSFESAAYVCDHVRKAAPEEVAEWFFPALLERIRAWDGEPASPAEQQGRVCFPGPVALTSPEDAS